MSKEADYTAQLTELGVYTPAFAGEIHQLCILERELSRAQKAWKATAPDKAAAPAFTDPHYEIINRLRRDILAHRDALGLTPKGLSRLRRAQEQAGETGGAANQAMAALLTRIKEQTDG